MNYVNSIMEITASNIHSTGSARSRSRSRTRNSGTKSRSTSSTRPSMGSRSLSSSSSNKIQINSTTIDNDKKIPTTSATLDNSLPLDFFKHELIGLIKALKIGKWHKRQLTIDNLYVNRISGALTNSIYKLEYKDPHMDLQLPSLLLRVYGKNVDSIIDRDSELKVLIKLSQKKIGPRLLGIFANGRFEQFLEGFVSLTKEQIKDAVISQMVGRRMKELHYKIDLDPEERTRDLPLSWKTIFKWMDIIEKEYVVHFEECGIKEEDIFFVKFDRFKELVKAYREWLFSKYENKFLESDLKFCHNDTQYGNLLLHHSFSPDEIVIPSSNSSEMNTLRNTTNKKDNNLVVIDFEYSGPNLPAYDLVNYFSEWMADYSDPEKSYFIHDEKYPSKLEQLNVLKSYVEYDFQYPSSALKTKSSPDVGKVNINELMEYEIKKLFNECIYWRPTVQVHWCLWGLIQNGPVKSVVNADTSSKYEQGVESTFTITTQMDNLQMEDAEEDGISSSDDLFDYLKYAQNKAAIFIADLIQHGLLQKSEIDQSLWDQLKYLHCDIIDI